MPMKDKLFLGSMVLGTVSILTGLIVMSRAFGKLRAKEFEEAIAEFPPEQQKLLRFQYAQQKDHERRIRNIVITTMAF